MLIILAKSISNLRGSFLFYFVLFLLQFAFKFQEANSVNSDIAASERVYTVCKML